jgi:hypothetical protein
MLITRSSEKENLIKIIETILCAEEECHLIFDQNGKVEFKKLNIY